MKELIVIGIVASLALGVAFARVTFSQPPPEVTYKGITYRADRTDDGVIRAISTQTGKELWSKRLYQVVTDRNLEDDMQWIYIREIAEKKGQIEIVNGNGTIFRLDPVTKEFVVMEQARKRGKK